MSCRAIWIRWLNHQRNRLLAGSIHSRNLKVSVKVVCAKRDHSPSLQGRFCKRTGLFRSGSKGDIAVLVGAAAIDFRDQLSEQICSGAAQAAS